VICHSCKQTIGTTTYVVQGYLGTYYECEWCFHGQPRPVYPEPELITDTFRTPPPAAAARGSGTPWLDAILDKLTGTSG
jgi:hypothetical protein